MTRVLPTCATDHTAPLSTCGVIAEGTELGMMLGGDGVTEAWCAWAAGVSRAARPRRGSDTPRTSATTRRRFIACPLLRKTPRPRRARRVLRQTGWPVTTVGGGWKPDAP